MQVAAFLANGIELVEEKDTRFGPHIVEESSKPLGGLAQITGHHSVVPNGEQWECQFECKAFREGRFAVSWRPNQQHTVSGFQAMGAQNLRSPLFFNQFMTSAPDGLREKHASQGSLRVASLNTSGSIPDTQVARLE